jgi:3-oxoacyl-[acyl-carrier protein] reductase
MKVNLHGKIAIVTGGTKNLGKALVEELLKNGAHVVTTYLQDDISATTMKKDFSMYSDKLSVHKIDCSIKSEVEKLCRDVYEDHGHIDILINNAALMDTPPFDEINDARFDMMMRNTLRSTIYMSIACLPYMKKGRIVNISSEGVSTGNPLEILYIAAKGGVDAVTRVFSRYGSPKGITVNAVAPHLIDSGMGKETFKRDPLLLSRIPLARFGKIEEFVATVLFLSSDESEYINGQVIHLNGGRIMHP